MHRRVEAWLVMLVVTVSLGYGADLCDQDGQKNGKCLESLVALEKAGEGNLTKLNKTVKEIEISEIIGFGEKLSCWSDTTKGIAIPRKADGKVDKDSLKGNIETAINQFLLCAYEDGNQTGSWREAIDEALGHLDEREGNLSTRWKKITGSSGGGCRLPANPYPVTHQTVEAHLERYDEIKDRDKCKKEKKTLEERLGRMGLMLEEQTAMVKARELAATGVNRESLMETIDKNIALTMEIREVLGVQELARYEKPLLTFGEYGENYVSFYSGVEYLSVEEFFNQPVPRIGFLFYSVDAYKDENTSFDYTVRFSYTSSGGEGAQAGDSQEAKQDTTFETEADLFWACFHSSERGKTGLLLSGGIMKSSDVDDSIKKVYLGFRTSKNPEMYLDLLYGSLGDHTRGEVRAQMPVWEWASDQKLVVGVLHSLNVKTDNLSSTPPPETTRMYLLYKVSLSGMLGTVR